MFQGLHSHIMHKSMYYTYIQRIPFKISFSNAINLLSNVPVSCLDVLISPSTQEEAKETDVKYNGMNMDAIQVLLKFMEKRIDKVRTF